MARQRPMGGPRPRSQAQRRRQRSTPRHQSLRPQQTRCLRSKHTHSTSLRTNMRGSALQPPSESRLTRPWHVSEEAITGSRIEERDRHLSADRLSNARKVIKELTPRAPHVELALVEANGLPVTNQGNDHLRVARSATPRAPLIPLALPQPIDLLVGISRCQCQIRCNKSGRRFGRRKLILCREENRAAVQPASQHELTWDKQRLGSASS